MAVVLKNPKHEKIAQGLAEGLSQAEAYRQAGYTTKWPDRACNDVLNKHPEIRERANEIRHQAAERARFTLDRAAERAATSKSYVIMRLHEMAERCMQHYPVLDRNGGQVYVETPDGKVAAAYTFDSKGAARALHLLGLEMGMFVHRVRFEKSPFDELPADQLQAIFNNLMALKQGRIIDQNPNAAALPAPRSRVDSESPE